LPKNLEYCKGRAKGAPFLFCRRTPHCVGAVPDQLAISGRLGHGAGDTGCRILHPAPPVRSDPSHIRPIGGEEFAAVLSVSDLDKALEIAERVRHNCASAAVGQPSLTCFRPSVSA
jgi:hypothetical protein